MDRGTAASRRAGGLLALLALVLALGGATTVLSLRALHLVAALPTHRVEPWVELAAVSVGALAAVALFIAVFPGNLNMVRLWWDKPWPMRIVAIARLPLQIPMITSALRVYRNS